MPPTLNGTDVSKRHRYLATARPEWSSTMQHIKNLGGPWPCPIGHPSLLCYRCSVCGKEPKD